MGQVRVVECPGEPGGVDTTLGSLLWRFVVSGRSPVERVVPKVGWPGPRSMVLCYLAEWSYEPVEHLIRHAPPVVSPRHDCVDGPSAEAAAHFLLRGLLLPRFLANRGLLLSGLGGPLLPPEVHDDGDRGGDAHSGPQAATRFAGPAARRRAQTIAFHPASTKAGSPEKTRNQPAAVPVRSPRPAHRHLPIQTGRVFTSGEGELIRWENFRRRGWQPAVVASAGEPYRFHDFRHSHGALPIAQGEHPEVTHSRLGHASIGTTLDTYGHLFEGLDEAAADRLEDAYRRSDVVEMWSVGPAEVIPLPRR